MDNELLRMVMAAGFGAYCAWCWVDFRASEREKE